MKEEGNEQQFISPDSTCFKTSNWKVEDDQVVKDISYTETSPNHEEDPNVKNGHREGTNEYG